MQNFTFKVIEVVGEYGNHYRVLIANEFPWIRCQVIPTPPSLRNRIISDLDSREEYYIFTDDTHEYVVMQMGGTQYPVILTPDNAKEVDRAIVACVQAAADFWAENGERIMKENSNVEV